MHSFRNLLRSSVAFSSRLGLGKSNVFCHNLPMSYMAGILNLIILPFASGGRVVVGRRFSVSNLAGFWNAPARYSVNTFCFIPTELALLLKLDRGSEGVEYARRTKIIGFVATAPLKPQLKQAFEERYGISLYESYGLSETLFVAANYPGRDRAGSVGLPLDGVSFEIGADGEVLIRTPWMFLGYSNAASPVQENCFPSGDLGEIEVDGGLRITGRKKDLIIRGGINISPRRIEELLDSSGAIEECAVVGVDDEILGEKVVCFFVPKGGDPDRVKRLSREVAAGLGKDYRIDKFVELRALPRNVNGKLDRQALRRSYTQ
jgi:long-chain acyl-CoA synthetase